MRNTYVLTFSTLQTQLHRNRAPPPPTANPEIHNHHQQPSTQPQPPPKNLNESKIQTHQQPSTKCVWLKRKEREREETRVKKKERKKREKKASGLITLGDRKHQVLNPLSPAKLPISRSVCLMIRPTSLGSIQRPFSNPLSPIKLPISGLALYCQRNLNSVLFFRAIPSILLLLLTFDGTN